MEQEWESLRTESRNLEDALRISPLDPSARPLLLRSNATRLQRALRQHIQETESPSGFLAEMQARAPRLSPKVSDLCAEHESLDRELDQLIQLLLTCRAEQDLDSARELATRIRRQIREHQSRANELFYQAFCVDIGPCD